MNIKATLSTARRMASGAAISFAVLVQILNVTPQTSPFADSSAEKFTRQELREIGAAAEMRTYLSPDGKKLAYTRKRSLDDSLHAPSDDLRTNIYVMNLSTKSTIRITSSGANYRPSWSPDSKKIAFSSFVNATKDSGNSNAVGPEAKNELQIWDSTSNKIVKFPEWQVIGWDIKFSPVVQWSPDSKRVYAPVLPKGLVPNSSEIQPENRSTAASFVLNSPMIEEKPQVNPPYEARRMSRIRIAEIDVVAKTVRDIGDSGATPGKFTVGDHGPSPPMYSLEQLLMSPDGTKLAVASNGGNAYNTFDEAISKLKIINLSDPKRRALDIKDNDAARLGLGGSLSYWSWSPNSKLIVTRQKRITWAPNKPSDYDADLILVDTASGQVSNVTNGRTTSTANLFKVNYDDHYPPIWSPDSSRVSVVTDGKIWKIPLDNKQAISCLSDGLPEELVFTGVLSPNHYYNHDSFAAPMEAISPDSTANHSDSIYGTAKNTKGGRTLVEFGIDGSRDILFTVDKGQIEPGPARDAAKRSIGKILLNSTSIASPIYRYFLDLDRGTGEVLPFTKRSLTEPLSRRFVLRWKLPSGKQAGGLLFLPPGTKSGAKLPLIVRIYPGTDDWSGPLNQWLGSDSVFGPELLVQEGYAVFWAGLPIGDKNMLRDIADGVDPALDTVIATGFVDPDRIGVIGHSYGGYGVFCLAVQQTRIKVGVSVDGTPDLLSAALGSFQGPAWALGQGRMPGLVWGNENAYRENSPIYQANRGKMPLLIVFGEHDTVYPAMGGKMMFEALQENNVPVEFAQYDGGHSPSAWRTELQDDYWDRVVSWFDLWLKGKGNIKYSRLLKTKTDWEKKLAETKKVGRNLKFQSLDGREIDLLELRAKVVLIDFWATWCGPCKKDLPNLEAVYEKYRNQGFEVVGVSLDEEKDRQKVIDYCKENAIPWPQHLDGRGMENAHFLEFPVPSLPATYLIDKDGQVVSTDARGDRLEPLVRKYLGLGEP